MKGKTFFIVFERLSFGEKIKNSGNLTFHVALASGSIAAFVIIVKCIIKLYLK